MDLKNSKSLSSSNTGNATNPQQSGERRVTLNLSRFIDRSAQSGSTEPNAQSEHERDTQAKTSKPQAKVGQPVSIGVSPAATAKVQLNASSIQGAIANNAAPNANAQTNTNVNAKNDSAASAKGKPAKAANKESKGNKDSKGSKTPPWMAQYLKKAEENKLQEQKQDDAEKNCAKLEGELNREKQEQSDLLARQQKLEGELKAKREHMEAVREQLVKLAGKNSFALDFVEFQQSFNKLDEELNQYLIEQSRLIDTEIQNGSLQAFPAINITEDTLEFFTTKKAKYKHKKVVTAEQLNTEISQYLRFKYCGLFKALCLYKFFCENFKHELFSQLEKQCQEYCRSVPDIIMTDVQRLIDDVEPLEVAANKLMRLALSDGKQLYQQLFHYTTSREINTFSINPRAEGESIAQASTFRADQLPSLEDDAFDTFFSFWSQMQELKEHEKQGEDASAFADTNAAQAGGDAAKAKSQANTTKGSDAAEDATDESSNVAKQVTKDAEQLAANHLEHATQGQSAANANLSQQTIDDALLRERFQTMFPENLDPKLFAEQLNRFDFNDGLFHFANPTLQELNNHLSTFDGFNYSHVGDVIDEAFLSSGREWLNMLGANLIEDETDNHLELVFYARLHDIYSPHNGLNNPSECINNEGALISCCPEANFKRNLLQLDQLSRQTVYLRRTRWSNVFDHKVGLLERKKKRLTTLDTLYPEYRANLTENGFASIVRFVLGLTKPERFVFNALLDSADSTGEIYPAMLELQKSLQVTFQLTREEQEKIILTTCDKLKKSILVELMADTTPSDGFCFHARFAKFVLNDRARVKNLIKLYATVKSLDERMNLELYYMNPSLRLMLECSETLNQGFKRNKQNASNYIEQLTKAVTDERFFSTFRNNAIDEFLKIDPNELKDGELYGGKLIPKKWRDEIVLKAMKSLGDDSPVDPQLMRSYFEHRDSFGLSFDITDMFANLQNLINNIYNN